MNDKESKFSQWLDSNVSNQKDTSIDNDLANDPVWQSRANTAKHLTHLAACYTDREAPQWDKLSGVRESKRSWWQWQGIPLLSLSFSVAAVALVLFKVELVVQDSAIMLSFGGHTQAQNNQLIDDKLKEFAAEQQVILANYVSDLSAKQQNNNLQLAGYILDATRSERKQDITDFVKYVNELRSEDKLNEQLKFQHLSRKIEAGTSVPLQKTNYQQKDTPVLEN